MIRSLTRLYSTVPKIEFPPSLLHLKVGKIIQCERHQNAEKLYVSQIQINNDDENNINNTIQVCSGLVNYIPIDQMLHKRVILVMNLKPSKMRGIKSEAMVLATEKVGCDNNEDTYKVELINPPISSSIGQRLQFEKFESESEPSRLKPKIWEQIQLHLMTNEKGEAVYIDDDKNQYLLKHGDDVAKSDTLCNSIIR
ncbi:hypothetical protein DFJ63DRAFT_199756 [Scheffersomyces coipomensis]|uniref:uncharacterized protein n=1 Tax=Scheffersomyces coipomensis TaxID=1788519 RepID=UPI00315CB47F